MSKVVKNCLVVNTGFQCRLCDWALCQVGHTVLFTLKNMNARMYRVASGWN